MIQGPSFSTCGTECYSVFCTTLPLMSFMINKRASAFDVSQQRKETQVSLNKEKNSFFLLNIVLKQE